MTVERSDFRFLSELFAEDAGSACLLAEYPSSNSDETPFQNRSKYIIHDPFPPPQRALLKVLGPHHLMCGWGQNVGVTSEVPPPPELIAHWQQIFGADGAVDWQPFDPDGSFITLFPHESIAADQQVVDPDVNYRVHSKEVIEQIDCPQAGVLDSVVPPCIAKLSHGYAGLGNFFIKDAADELAMRDQLDAHWPTATLVINSVIQNIVGDFGVQFYLKRNGDMVWMGFTQQHFNENQRWCGGTFSAPLQDELFEEFQSVVQPVGKYLHSVGYFGVVGIDILRDRSNKLFLVDVNPRLTGISPFLIASRIFAHEGLGEGIYRASCRFHGSMTDLFATAQEVSNARVVVLSAFEEPGSGVTRCHLSVSSESQDQARSIMSKIVES